MCSWVFSECPLLVDVFMFFVILFQLVVFVSFNNEYNKNVNVNSSQFIFVLVIFIYKICRNQSIGFISTLITLIKSPSVFIPLFFPSLSVIIFILKKFDVKFYPVVNSIRFFFFFLCNLLFFIRKYFILVFMSIIFSSILLYMLNIYENEYFDLIAVIIALVGNLLCL
jgi:hypothetical protein